MDLKEEAKNLIKACVVVSVCLGYSYVFVGKIIPKGFPRLLMILPVVGVFVWIPLLFNSVHLIGAFAFSISWLAGFKLILFAFGKGPLHSNIPFSRFLSFACFPVGINNNGTTSTTSPRKSPLNYGIKALLFVIFLKVYHDYYYLKPMMMGWIFFAFSVYLGLELVLAMTSIILASLLGVNLQPQFAEPLLSTSLQDFWGRRWNLTVNRILYSTIYNPVCRLSTRVIGRVWAPIPAILATFAVSGLMHELIFFYFTRDWPTWDTMLFFCLHGVSLVMEIVIKKLTVKVVNFPPYITTPFVYVFVFGTSYWLFYPEIMRCKIIERAFQEYEAMAKLATTPSDDSTLIN